MNGALARKGWLAYGSGIAVWAVGNPAWMGDGALFWIMMSLSVGLGLAGVVILATAVFRSS